MVVFDVACISGRVHPVICHGDVTSNVPPSEHCVRVGTMLAILLCTSEPSFLLHSCLYTPDKSGMCQSLPLLTPVLGHFPCDSAGATTCT